MKTFPRWPWRLGAVALLLALALLVRSWFTVADVLPNRVVRIGLVPFSSVNEPVIDGFKQVLQEQGWQEGRNVEFRSTPMDGNISQLEPRIRELLSWQPDLLLAMSTPPAQAAYRLTQTSATPLVFAPVSDPLAAGVVPSLAQPGAHVTGVRLLPSNGLRLEALQRMAPQVRRIYVPYSREDRSALVTLEQIEPAARQLGLELLLQPVDTLEDIMQAAERVPATAQAIFLPQDSRIEANVALFIKVAQARRLPLSVPSLLQVEQGALMSFGFDHRQIGRQAGQLATDILRGSAPGRLPVETVDNHLYINLRAAQAIGLEVDDALLRQARRVLR